MIYTLRNIVDFCAEHCGDKCFKGANYNGIAGEVIKAVTENRLISVEDDLGICGVCIYTPFHHFKSIFVNHVVARRGGFITLVAEARKLYPGWTIQGRRGDKVITYRHLWVTTQAQAK